MKLNAQYREIQLDAVRRLELDISVMAWFSTTLISFGHGTNMALLRPHHEERDPQGAQEQRSAQEEEGAIRVDQGHGPQVSAQPAIRKEAQQQEGGEGRVNAFSLYFRFYPDECLIALCRNKAGILFDFIFQLLLC